MSSPKVFEISWLCMIGWTFLILAWFTFAWEYPPAWVFCPIIGLFGVAFVALIICYVRDEI